MKNIKYYSGAALFGLITGFFLMDFAALLRRDIFSPLAPLSTASLFIFVSVFVVLWRSYCCFIAGRYNQNVEVILRKDLLTFIPLLILLLSPCRYFFDISARHREFILAALFTISFSSVLCLKILLSEIDFKKIKIHPVWKKIRGKAIYFLMSIYALVFSLLSVLSYKAYNMGLPDLSHIDQALWSTLQGRWLDFTYIYT
ncbi:MAG: hypothetical protein KAV18_05140 [Candidatus Omnitrophica bacterium]|nr:hypothetical protein [Candidatus Omnitrophota bacterium]